MFVFHHGDADEAFAFFAIADARGHGDSEGSYIGMGWHDRLDLVAWAESLVAQDQNSLIVLYGVSMGAATVLMASGEALPPNVKAVVEAARKWQTSEMVLKQKRVKTNKKTRK